MPITLYQQFSITATQDMSYTIATEIITISYTSPDSLIMIINFSQLNLDYCDKLAVAPAFS